jgi:hypothetical protein
VGKNGNIKYNVGAWEICPFTIFYLLGRVFMEVRIYEREKLYEEIWAEPMIKVAERYGVSDVTLKKTCNKLNIPVPGRGHWARIYAGEKIPIPKLPKHKGQDKIVVTEYTDRAPQIPKELRKTESLKFLPEERREEVRSFCALVQVPDELTKPHALIKDTIQYFKSRKDSTRPPVNRVMNFSVSDMHRERAYRIWDALFKSLESLGYMLRSNKEEHIGVAVRILTMGHI